MAREEPLVARDFLGLGNIGMEDSASGEVVTGKQNLLHVSGRIPSVNASAPHNRMTMAGVKPSAWSKAATTQVVLPLRKLCNERYNEKIAENVPERPFVHLNYHLQMQDLTTKNDKNGIIMQVDGLTKSNDQGVEDYCSSGGFQASANRSMISPSKPKAMTASDPRLPSPGIPADMQHDAPLTMFYAGSVKVFFNISAEQAQAIMHLASVGNVTSNMVDTMAATVAGNCTTTLWPQDKSVMNLPSNQTVLNHVKQPTIDMKFDIGHLNIPSPLSPGSSAQPLVPTALPHARKASLTRFLERRKERLQSKCPYGRTREDLLSPEERLSSSNEPTCHDAAIEDAGKKRRLIPSWMLESVGVKEPNII